MALHPNLHRPACVLRIECCGVGATLSVVAPAAAAVSWAERDLPLQEIAAVAAAYEPAAPGFRFKALFLNAVGDPAQHVRPPGVEVRAEKNE